MFSFLQRVHPFIRWIRYLSFNYYMYRILLKIQYGTDQWYDCSSPTGCKSIRTFSPLRSIPLDGGIEEATVMLIMVFGYRLWAYLSLLRMKLRVQMCLHNPRYEVRTVCFSSFLNIRDKQLSLVIFSAKSLQSTNPDFGWLGPCRALPKNNR